MATLGAERSQAHPLVFHRRPARGTDSIRREARGQVVQEPPVETRQAPPVPQLLGTQPLEDARVTLAKSPRIPDALVHVRMALALAQDMDQEVAARLVP